MIHVLTVHFQTDRWIDIQLDHLARYLDRPHRVVADLEGVEPEWEQRFDAVTHLSAEASVELSHPEKLNRLAALVGQDAVEYFANLFFHECRSRGGVVRTPLRVAKAVN